MTAAGRRLPSAPAQAVLVDTILGRMWFHADEEAITPGVQLTGLWEPHLTHFLRHVVEPGMRFVDVGAHVGYFSVLASQLVGPRGEVHAFEVEPRTISILRENIWMHARHHGRLHPVAAYASRGLLRLAVNDVQPSGSGIWPGQAIARDSVPATTLDDRFPSARIDVLKVDAEGSDHCVVEGFAQGIRERRLGLAVVEFFPRALSLHGAAPGAVLEQYLSLGLRLEVLDAHGEAHPSDPAEILAADDDIVTLVLVPD